MIDPYPINTNKLDLEPCVGHGMPPGYYDLPCEWVIDTESWLSDPFHKGDALWQLFPNEISMSLSGVALAYIGPGYEENPYIYPGVVTSEGVTWGVTYSGSPTPNPENTFPSHGFIYTMYPIFMIGDYSLHCLFNEGAKPTPYETYGYQVIARNPIRWAWYDLPQYFGRIGGGRCRIPFGTPGEPWGDDPDYAIILYGFNLGYPHLANTSPLLSSYIFPMIPVLPMLAGMCLFSAAVGNRKGKR